MYTITVSRPGEAHEQAVYSLVEEYEIKDGLLTVALSSDHDIVIPLFQVTAVDIVKQ